MKLFGRKNGKNSSSGELLAREHRNVSAQGAVTHRFTKDLARSETLATMLAHSRAATVVEVADLLAGMYIYDWERLSKYWPEQDGMEEYLQQICRISPQRWHHWIQFYDQQRHSDEKPRKWKWLRPVKSVKTNNSPLPRSTELLSLLKSAEEIAPAHDMVENRSIPILTCECVLLAIAKRKDSELGHRLVASGLNVAELEQAARNPRHAPLH
jgi:hypothetical protein